MHTSFKAVPQSFTGDRLNLMALQTSNRSFRENHKKWGGPLGVRRSNEGYL